MKPLQRFETNAGRVIYSFPVRSFPTLTNNIYVIDDGRQYVLIDTGSGMERPNADLFITRKLTDYTLALYASPAYLEQAPPLNHRDDLAHHHWIGYVDDLLFSQELLFLNTFCRTPTVTFRSTSVIAQQQAARAGLGIAVLPNYMARHDSELVRVLPQESVQRSYWISTRRELHKSVRLRVVWDFLLELCTAEQTILLAP